MNYSLPDAFGQVDHYFGDSVAVGRLAFPGVFGSFQGQAGRLPLPRQYFEYDVPTRSTVTDLGKND